MNELDTLEMVSQQHASFVRLFIALLGDIIALLGLIATLATLWHWIADAPNLLLMFALFLLCGVPWLALFAFCAAKAANFFKDRHREGLLEEYAREIIEGKRAERKRLDEAHATEMHLKRTRLSADERGNRPFIYDEESGEIVEVASGNFVQPVPSHISYSIKGELTSASKNDVPALPAPRISRPTVEECAAQIVRNSLQVCLGRDLKDEGAYLIEDLHENHLLLIGGTRKGKSCQATQIIDQMTSTHDRDHLLISLLDLEDQNCNLFTDLPHIARVQLANGKTIKSIARSAEEVAAHLGYLVDLMDERYNLSPRDRAKAPKVLVYIEEFVELKRRLKNKPSVLAQMADDFTTLATRGIKAGIHLMVCAQASYSQEEFRDAMGQLIGINLAFCAKPSLARAAGFMNTELLNENFLAKQPGQFALESTNYTTIGLAPEYNVKAKLEAMQEAEEARLSGAHRAPVTVKEVQEEIEGQDERRLIAFKNDAQEGAHPTRTLPAPEDAPGWEGFVGVIEQLQDEGKNQDQIIEKIWHAKKGSGNQKYLEGRAIYRRCNEAIKLRRQQAFEHRAEMEG